MNLEINIFTWKGFEQCVREETAHLSTLKSKSLLIFLKRLQRLKQEWQKSPVGPGKEKAKTWFGLEKKKEN
jgi:hypothetical protein